MRLRSEWGLVKRKLSTGKIVYYYWIYDENDIRVYRSTGEKTKAKAMDYVLKLRDEGSLGVIDRVMTPLGVFAKDFFLPDKCPIVRNAEMRGKAIAGGTLKTWRNNLTKHILPHLGKKAVTQINKDVINRWLLDLPAKDGISRATANNCFMALRMVMSEAVRQNLLRGNPCDRVEKLGNDSERYPAFTIDEVKALIGKPEDWKNPMIRSMCLVGAVTGMRIGEVRALKPECITETSIHIKYSFSDEDGLKTPKNGKERVAPIPPIVRDDLLQWASSDGGFLFRLYKNDEPLSCNWIGKCIAKRCGEVGIKGKTFHSFRAFFNTEMKARSVDGEIVRSVIGHSSADMTEHYLHLESTELPQFREAQLDITNRITIGK